MQVNLPTPSGAYTPPLLATIFRAISLGFLRALATDEAADSFLLKSPDGHIWKVSLPNAVFTTAAAATTTTTLTVASGTGIRVGMSISDTTRAVIATGTKVVGVSGTTITLSAAPTSTGIALSDALSFTDLALSQVS